MASLTGQRDTCILCAVQTVQNLVRVRVGCLWGGGATLQKGDDDEVCEVGHDRGPKKKDGG